jgi:hypothetical protein
MTQTITPEYILNLFETSPTVIITEGKSVTSDKYNSSKKRRGENLSRVLRDTERFDYNERQANSPITQRILEHAGPLTPGSKTNLLGLISKDTQRVNLITKEQEKLDKLYKQYYDSELGVFIERWICSKIKCPGCKKGKLLKFVNSSFPVIDVKCDGKNHDIEKHGPLYFQIKATNGFAKSGLYPNYFDFNKDSDKSYIKIGSKRFGSLSHSVRVNSPLDIKKLLIGYICVHYRTNTETKTGSLRLSINFDTSFILIPDIAKKEVPENYYTYIDGEPSTITFNKSHFLVASTFAELNLKELFKPIDTNTEFSEIEYLPESDTEKEMKRMKMMKKYLKYKMKYLQLKKLIENN